MLKLKTYTHTVKIILAFMIIFIYNATHGETCEILNLQKMSSISGGCKQPCVYAKCVRFGGMKNCGNTSFDSCSYSSTCLCDGDIKSTCGSCN
jgi:hypothetical protein